MGRYLAYTSPARGHLYPMVATLLELRRRGHEVHVRTLASEVPALEALGLDAGPVAAVIEDRHLDDWTAATVRERLGRSLRTFPIARSTRCPASTAPSPRFVPWCSWWTSPRSAPRRSPG